ncbi:MAG: class I SAM-dependent methyltransferase [Candidatus Poribacteria bacterium]
MFKDSILRELAYRRASRYGLSRIKLENFLPSSENINLFFSISNLKNINKTFPIAYAVNCVTRLCNPVNIFEFGTYKGETTLMIAQNVSDKNATVYTLDILQEEVIKYKNEMISSDFKLATINDSEKGKVLLNYNGQTKIIRLFGDSYTYDFTEYYGKMNFIYVDGSHKYKFVKKDTENAFKMLANTGIIMWDDVMWDDVMRCLAEFRKNYQIYYLDNGHSGIYCQINGVPQEV